MTSPYHPAPQEPTPDPTPESTAVGVPGVPVAPGATSPYLQQPAAAGYVPPTGPVAPPIYRYPASALHAGIRAGIGGLLVIALLVTAAYGSMFPSNAPVEQLMNFGLLIDFVAAAIVLFIFAGLTVGRMSRPTVPGRTSPLAITGLVLTSIGLVGWLFFSLIPSLSTLADGDRLRFMTLAAGPFFLGFVWATGLVMGALSLRAVGGRSRLLGVLAVAIGLLVVIASVVPAILYGLELTD